jgi:hypothetical protein
MRFAVALLPLFRLCHFAPTVNSHAYSRSRTGAVLGLSGTPKKKTPAEVEPAGVLAAREFHFGRFNTGLLIASVPGANGKIA